MDKSIRKTIREGNVLSIAPGFYQVKLFGLNLTIRTFGRNGGRQVPKIVFGKDWVAIGIGRRHIEFGRVMVSRADPP